MPDHAPLCRRRADVAAPLLSRHQRLRSTPCCTPLLLPTWWCCCTPPRRSVAARTHYSAAAAACIPRRPPLACTLCESTRSFRKRTSHTCEVVSHHRRAARSVKTQTGHHNPATARSLGWVFGLKTQTDHHNPATTWSLGWVFVVWVRWTRFPRRTALTGTTKPIFARRVGRLPGSRLRLLWTTATARAQPPRTAARTAPTVEWASAPPAPATPPADYLRAVVGSANDGGIEQAVCDWSARSASAEHPTPLKFSFPPTTRARRAAGWFAARPSMLESDSQVIEPRRCDAGPYPGSLLSGNTPPFQRVSRPPPARAAPLAGSLRVRVCWSRMRKRSSPAAAVPAPIRDLCTQATPLHSVAAERTRHLRLRAPHSRLHLRS